MSAIKRLTKAKAALIIEQPFYASLLFRMPFVESTAVETMGVNGREIFYNPDSDLDTMPMAQLKGVLCHEVMHCANGHHTRRGGRDFMEWNEACDLAINPLIIGAGMELPDDSLDDATWAGMSAEAIYHARHSSHEPGDDKPEPDQGKGDDDADGAQGDDGTPGDDSQGDDGQSGDDGQDGDGSQGASDVGGCGCVMDFPGDTDAEPSPAELATERQDWNVAMAQAAQTARVAGELGADLERMVKDALTPKAPWEDLLREFMAQKASDDYSWSPPNRRYIWRDLYLPSTTSTRMGTMVIAVDNSGSITDATLAQFAGELNCILEDVTPEIVHVVYCDARVCHVDEITPEDFPVKLEAHGGGGTRFAPVFDWVSDNDIEPACLVYLTDMISSDLATLEDPGYPVLWADICDDSNYRPPFGEHVVIDQ